MKTFSNGERTVGRDLSASESLQLARLIRKVMDEKISEDQCTKFDHLPNDLRFIVMSIVRELFYVRGRHLYVQGMRLDPDNALLKRKLGMDLIEDL